MRARRRSHARPGWSRRPVCLAHRSVRSRRHGHGLASAFAAAGSRLGSLRRRGPDRSVKRFQVNRSTVQPRRTRSFCRGRSRSRTSVVEVDRSVELDGDLEARDSQVDLGDEPVTVEAPCGAAPAPEAVLAHRARNKQLEVAVGDLARGARSPRITAAAAGSPGAPPSVAGQRARSARPRQCACLAVPTRSPAAARSSPTVRARSRIVRVDVGDRDTARSVTMRSDRGRCSCGRRTSRRADAPCRAGC